MAAASKPVGHRGLEGGQMGRLMLGRKDLFQGLVMHSGYGRRTANSMSQSESFPLNVCQRLHASTGAK